MKTVILCHHFAYDEVLFVTARWQRLNEYYYSTLDGVILNSVHKATCTLRTGQFVLKGSIPPHRNYVSIKWRYFLNNNKKLNLRKLSLGNFTYATYQ